MPVPRSVSILAVSLALILAGGGCESQSSREADRPYTGGLARVTSLSLVPGPRQSTHVQVIARGELPDPCTRIDSERHERFGQRIEVTLTTRRESGAMCAQMIQPFSRTLVIPIADLPDGAYTIDVNGVSRIFDVHHDFRRPDLD